MPASNNHEVWRSLLQQHIISLASTFDLSLAPLLSLHRVRRLPRLRCAFLSAFPFVPLPSIQPFHPSIKQAHTPSRSPSSHQSTLPNHAPLKPNTPAWDRSQSAFPFLCLFPRTAQAQPYPAPVLYGIYSLTQSMDGMASLSEISMLCAYLHAPPYNTTLHYPQAIHSLIPPVLLQYQEAGITWLLGSQRAEMARFIPADYARSPSIK